MNGQCSLPFYMLSSMTWRILPLPFLLRSSLFLLWGPCLPPSLVPCLSRPSIVVYMAPSFAQTSVIFLDGPGFLPGPLNVCIHQCDVPNSGGIYSTCFCLLLQMFTFIIRGVKLVNFGLRSKRFLFLSVACPVLRTSFFLSRLWLVSLSRFLLVITPLAVTTSSAFIYF